ncbi:MAG: formimidoylglutamate deiminase [Pyrinomonadaceae bacterium]
MNRPKNTAWLADLIYTGDRFEAQVGIACNDVGRISSMPAAPELENPIQLKNRALLPGLVNAHSHAFQRVIRGRTEYRTGNKSDSFWTWREMMYSAAARLSPEDIYDASRMAFLEMALSGITAIGEFHYLHNQPDGCPYDEPNLLAKEVIRAARDVGLRIALLRVAYARSGYEKDPNPRQARFIEADSNDYLRHLAQLQSSLANNGGQAWVGIAPHSVRAVPLNYLKEVVAFGNDRRLPVHMHVAEQQAEVSACIHEYGRSPVALLETEGLLSDRFTAVHAIHVTPKAARMLSKARAQVCACPTTERNLGDGIVPAHMFFENNVCVSLGTDSQIQVDLLEDARELEYHLRLQRMERVVLADQDGEGHSALAARLFDCVTINGAHSIGATGGALVPGTPADFFTVDLDDPSIAGASQNDLLSSIVFSLSRTAVKDVVVGGKRIVEDGRHAAQDEIVQKFSDLQRKLWG